MSRSIHGVVPHESDRPTDFLYRISIKCVIRNTKGEVLVVKERGRQSWDLPGGGMDHGEDIRRAIAREMAEEVNLKGNFTHRIIEVEDPKIVESQGFWQLRLIFGVTAENMNFSAGNDADEIMFTDPNGFASSDIKTEQRIFRYATSI